MYLSSKTGFSLVGILASTATLGILSLNFLQFIRQSNRAIQTLSSSEDLVDWSRAVSISLGDSATCSKSLFNSLGTTPRWAPDSAAVGITANQQLAEIRLHAAGEVLASVVASRTMIRNLFITSSLTLTETDISRRTVSSGSTRYFTQLSILGTKTRGGYSSKGIDKKYYLWLTTDSSHNITGCSLDSSGGSGGSGGGGGVVTPGVPPDTGGMARVSGECEAPDSESDSAIYAGYAECPSGKTIRAAGVDCGDPRIGSVISSYPVTTSKWYASCCVDGTPPNLATMIKLICA